MRTADVVVDIGPGAGAEGGEILTAGTLADVIANPKSETGAYLSGTQVHPDSAPPARAARLARRPQRARPTICAASTCAFRSASLRR